MVLVPVEPVCQYHVSPDGADPFAVSVTPDVTHCGELDSGFAGFAGSAFMVTVKFDEALTQEFAFFTVMVPVYVLAVAPAGTAIDSVPAAPADVKVFD